MATNIDIVRTGYESFIRGDIQTTLAMFAENIEWHEPEWTYGPASGDFCGRDEVLRKATLLGLAAIPRTVPPSPISPWVKRGVVTALVILAIGVAAWVVLSMLRAGAGR